MSCPLSLVKYDRMWHLVCLRNLYYQGCFNTVLCFVAQSCPTLWPHRLPGSCVCGDSPGKNTGMGCYALFQGIFLTQGSNPHLLFLLHWQMGSLSQLKQHFQLIMLYYFKKGKSRIEMPKKKIAQWHFNSPCIMRSQSQLLLQGSSPDPMCHYQRGCWARGETASNIATAQLLD